MASVLVDLEDISYIDDITDDDLNSTEEENNNNKAKKKKKNRLVGEQLQIDPDNKLLKELRQERQESKRVLDSIDEGEKQVSQDLAKLQAIIKDREKQKIIQDLREERAKFSSDHTTESTCNESIIELKDDIDRFDSVGEFYLYQPKQKTMTKENKDKMNKDTDNKDKKRKSSGNEYVPQSNESDAYAKLENDAMLETTAEPNDEIDAHIDEGTELGEVQYSFTDKSKLVKTDSKSELRPKGKRQKPFDDGKENVNVSSPNTGENEDKNMMMNDANDTTHLLKSKMSDNKNFKEITNEEKSDFNGAKPKLFTKRVNGHDMQLKELNLELFPSTETSRKLEKGKGSKKKKSKAPLEGPEQNLLSTGSDIKILVTDVEGTEVVAHMSESTTGTSRDTSTWNSKLGDCSELSSPSNAANTPNTGKSTPLNYLRQLSEENEGTKGNLLAQAELYKQQKAKPFQKLTKMKCGLLSVGIEGDSKRSYIKAMAMMPDKQFIMFDKNNKCLKLFDQDFNPLDKVGITTKYCGLTAIFDGNFAATLPTTKKLQFYHINNDTDKICRERTHPVEGEFYSITYHRRRLYLIHRIRTANFTGNDKWEVRKLNTNKKTEEMTTIRKFTPFHKDCNLLANDQGVYVTNRLENEVLMLKHDGTILNRHKVEFSLPVAMTCDKFGNIYVCGGAVTSFIEIIKPDLQRYRMIYKKTSSNPVALCFDKDDNILYVSDQILGKIIKYRIHYSGTVQGLMKAMLFSSPSELS